MKEIDNVKGIGDNLGEFLTIILNRYRGLESTQKIIVKLEKGINDSDVPVSLEEKINIYDKLMRLHILQSDSVRKILMQVNLNEMIRGLGLVDLVNRFRNLSDKSLRKVQLLLEEVKEAEIEEDKT